MSELLQSHHIPDLISKSEQLLTLRQLQLGIDKVAKTLSERFQQDHPICVCVMSGGLFVTAELLQKLTFPLQLDYLQVARYHGYSQGQSLQWLRQPNIDPAGRSVIVIDDILDGGITLAEITRYYINRGAEVTSVVLLDKKVQRQRGGLIKADYACFSVDNQYVYGFGLDYHGYLRNMPGIYTVPDEYIRRFG